MRKGSPTWPSRRISAIISSTLTFSSSQNPVFIPRTSVVPRENDHALIPTDSGIRLPSGMTSVSQQRIYMDGNREPSSLRHQAGKEGILSMVGNYGMDR
ncbi:hypothetical protein BDV27DRAFT_40018 [Aspergillus caelatus]|uniref:Uncharacterized protein n=1 Tax=Aspergillus caelatus TaxID=61420 RepID=A0A5N7AFD1_9EURO|nr:uncharacterized protein BDV27DRAFT_40018 [Aspergillus caelatus]KAE8368532.1 hypothetical protein BDV27DRAFT_40018 [Aspergillus caelatus]